jgi:tetratricopeptide (TPR) repeat protein
MIRGLRIQPLDVLDPTAAVALFAERYQTQGGAWDAARDTAPAANVVEILGYLPLAIELQAARAALFQPDVAALAATLDHDRGQGLLGDPNDPQSTARYSFEKSLRTLTPRQRTRFAALGLPAGPDWPRPLIERLFAGIPDGDANGSSDSSQDTAATVGAEDTEDMEIESSPRALAAARADLDRLVALSLAALPPPEGRVRLHPLLREYAAERWQEATSAATQSAALHALLAALLDLADEHEHDFPALAQEEELLVAALEQAHNHDTGATPRQINIRVVSLVEVLHDYLSLGGHWATGLRLRAWQLAACRALGDRSDEGRILNNLGLLARNLGQPEAARSYYEQALAMLREVGDRAGEGAILNNLGALARSLGQKEAARDYYEQALAITREVGDRAGEGTTLNNLGALADDLGQHEAARDYYEQALAISREVGDRDGAGTTLNNLGTLARNLGQHEAARNYYEQALAIFQAIGAVDSARVVADNLADLDRASVSAEAPAPSFSAQPAIADLAGSLGSPSSPASESPPDTPAPRKRHWWFRRR